MRPPLHTGRNSASRGVNVCRRYNPQWLGVLYFLGHHGCFPLRVFVGGKWGEGLKLVPCLFHSLSLDYPPTLGSQLLVGMVEGLWSIFLSRWQVERVVVGWPVGVGPYNVPR